VFGSSLSNASAEHPVLLFPLVFDKDIAEANKVIHCNERTGSLAYVQTLGRKCAPASFTVAHSIAQLSPDEELLAHFGDPVDDKYPVDVINLQHFCEYRQGEADSK
jgi:hypothetical protein